MNQQCFNEQLLQFLSTSVTPYHATAVMSEKLKKSGFIALDEKVSWSLTEGKGYYVIRDDASLIAFRIGKRNAGFRMVGAHTDSPCLKVKPCPDRRQHNYFQLGVEVYGGALLNPWFDRDLSIAGRIHYLDNQNKLQKTLINFHKAIATIPSLAIHLDRTANSNKTINPQIELNPIVSQSFSKDKVTLNAILSEYLQKKGVHCYEILAHDLSFYDTTAPSLIGLNDDFIASARLDNLLSCFVGIEALISHQNSDFTSLLICNDHEEVGSCSATGASGTFLKDVLARIIENKEKRLCALADSVLISADNAHGIHPNYLAKHDPQHQPLLNQGVVIKINSNQRYATSDATMGLFILLCKKIKAKLQYFSSRNDVSCGSTIGPLTATELGIKTIDIGLPTFAMHSIRELAGSQDAYELMHILQQFMQVKI